MAFNPALIVVDMQNDFCSPEGTNPVAGNGMSLVVPISKLLSMPGFALRISASLENHKDNKVLIHNHKNATPFETQIDLPNTKKGMGHQTVKQLLLPTACVKGTWGAQLVDGLRVSDFDLVVTRNSHPDVWMYSPFKDVHGNRKHDLHPDAVSHHLGDEMASKKITDVFCVGAGGDFCVSHTAMDVVSEGFKTYVIEDATRSFDDKERWVAMKKELGEKGIEVVMMDGPEVGRVRALGDGQGD